MNTACYVLIKAHRDDKGVVKIERDIDDNLDIVGIFTSIKDLEGKYVDSPPKGIAE